MPPHVITNGCSVPSCVNGHFARGLCRLHYDRLRKVGSALPDVPPRRWGTPEERFWSRVTKLPDDGCWEWTGRLRNGYGVLEVRGVIVGAHRFSWELVNGPIPDGVLACHRCDNPPCVRPDHLFLGTDGDNLQDAYNKGRRPEFNHSHPQAVCRNGHPLTPETTYLCKGKRACKACQKIRVHDYNKRRKFSGLSGRTATV